MNDVNDPDRVAARFEAERARLRTLAYRMLGSRSEADDAVQEVWLRLARAGADGVENLPAWLRTALTRICLDVLRSRRARREETSARPFDRAPGSAGSGDPEGDALLAESVSGALLVVLNTLTPAERVAFVLHDTFSVPFEEIARVVKRTPVAAKKLASRARRKVRGSPVVAPDELARHRRVVSAFLTAARAGDVAAIAAVLAPDVVRRMDAVALPPGSAAEVRGADAVAKGTLRRRRLWRRAELVLVDGKVGLVVAPRGRVLLAVTFVVQHDAIAECDVIAERARLRRLDLAVLD